MAARLLTAGKMSKWAYKLWSLKWEWGSLGMQRSYAVHNLLRSARRPGCHSPGLRPLHANLEWKGKLQRREHLFDSGRVWQAPIPDSKDGCGGVFSRTARGTCRHMTLNPGEFVSPTSNVPDISGKWCPMPRRPALHNGIGLSTRGAAEETPKREHCASPGLQFGVEQCHSQFVILVLWMHNAEVILFCLASQCYHKILS